MCKLGTAQLQEVPVPLSSVNINADGFYNDFPADGSKLTWGKCVSKLPDVVTAELCRKAYLFYSKCYAFLSLQ